MAAFLFLFFFFSATLSNQHHSRIHIYIYTRNNWLVQTLVVAIFWLGLSQVSSWSYMYKATKEKNKNHLRENLGCRFSSLFPFFFFLSFFLSFFDRFQVAFCNTINFYHIFILIYNARKKTKQGSKKKKLSHSNWWVSHHVIKCIPIAFLSNLNSSLSFFLILY